MNCDTVSQQRSKTTRAAELAGKN